jgi:S1-C subfamily serine protease
MSASQRCPRCGRRLPDRSLSCGCGYRAPGPASNPFAHLDASLKGEPSLQSSPLPPPRARYAPVSPDPNSRRVGLAVAGLFIFLAAAAAILAIPRPQTDTPTPSPISAAPTAPPARPAPPPHETPTPAASLPPAAPASSAPVAPATPPPSSHLSPVPQDVIAKVKRSVVLILGRLPDGVASGTGFVAGPQEVGTCAHVVDGATKIVLVTADGQKMGASVQSIDPLNDVAVLHAEGPLPPPLTLGANSAVREGDEIAVTGYPEIFGLDQLGFEPASSTSRGTVSAKRTIEKEGSKVDELQIDAPLNHGNSGGPVYLTSDGTVIGLAQSVISDTQGLNFAASVDALKAQLATTEHDTME